MTGTWSSSANLTQLGGRAGAQDAGAGQDDRPLGATASSCERRSRISSSVARAGPARGGRRGSSLGRDLVEEVLGQGQQDRSGPAAEGLAHGLGHDRRDLIGGHRLGRPLGEPAERGDLVDLLERLAAQEAPLDLTDEREHRGRVLPGRVDADGEVGAPDGPRPEARRRSAGQLPVRLGHERRAALVARRDDADPGVLERVEHAEERLARAR